MLRISIIIARGLHRVEVTAFALHIPQVSVHTLLTPSRLHLKFVDLFPTQEQSLVRVMPSITTLNRSSPSLQLSLHLLHVD